MGSAYSCQFVKNFGLYAPFIEVYHLLVQVTSKTQALIRQVLVPSHGCSGVKHRPEFLRLSRLASQ